MWIHDRPNENVKRLRAISRLSRDIVNLSSKDVEEALLEKGGFKVSNTVSNSNDGFAASTSVNQKPMERCGKAEMVDDTRCALAGVLVCRDGRVGGEIAVLRY